MKVLQINKLYFPVIGGIENHLYLLVNEIKSKVDLKVLVCNTCFKTVVEKEKDLEIIRIASPGILFSMPLGFSIPLWIKKIDADIIHVHHPYPMAALAYLLVRPKGKLVITYHSDIVKQKLIMWFLKPLLMHFFKKADRILPTSPRLIDSSSILSKFREKCTIVPLGIDIKQFEFTQKVQAESEKIRNKYGAKILLFIGRLVYYKGVEFLIRAMKGVDARLLLIGDGQLKDDLIKLAQELGVDNKIVFLKPVADEELAFYYYACDMFVLPSIASSEAFGIVQLESQFCGKPVISTDLPTGVPYANLHEKTGLIVPPKDSDALTAAINRLLDNPELRKEYGKNGHQRVMKEFTKERVAERVLSVYDELVR
ncbi:MAG: glycosyltransferase [bacterium]|nr:glycosyltransferase [bacterium]